MSTRRRPRSDSSRPHRRPLTALLVVVGATATASVLLQYRPSPPRPNVLLISVDTLRADHLGTYGGDVATPNLDALAGAGVVFERAVSHAPLTLPAHASMLTGRYPLAHGVRDNGTFHLPDEEQTLAETFRGSGYRTAAFVGSFVLDRRFGLGQGFDTYDDRVPAPSERVVSGEERRADQVLQAARRWLSQRNAEPWFVFVHLYDPHWPYEPPPPFARRYRESPYAGEVAYVDHALGAFLDELREEGALENTIIVVTADHGEGLGEHGERTHGPFAYESTLRVPLVISFETLLPAGGRVPTRVRLVDLAPTVVELAGLDADERFQGTSLLGLLTTSADGDERGRDAYFEAVGFALQNDSAPLTGLYRGRHKYIQLPIPELYDVEMDPNETRNLVSERRELQAEMRAALERFVAENGGRSRESESATIDEDTRERLAALGYASGGAMRSLRSPEEYTAADDPKRLMGVTDKIGEGVRAYRDGRRDDAARMFRAAIQERPASGPAHTYLARVLHEQGRLEQAIAVLEEAVGRGVRAPGARQSLGLYLQEAGRLESSVAVLEPLVRDGERDPRVYEALAIAYATLGDGERAAHTLETLLRLSPDHVGAHTNLGPIYLRAGRLADAERVLLRALELEPTRATGWHSLGVVYGAQERTDDAIAAWKRAVELEGDRYESLYNLSVVLAGAGRRREALEHARRFLGVVPGDRYRAQVSAARRMIRDLEGAERAPE